MKEKQSLTVEPRVLEAVRQAAVDGRLTCTEARRLAGELNVPVRVVGAACDALGVKIKACELGCF
ncbi:hypothetical protein [Desulfofundulus thermocisternus]|uniref:hypothetical protein n=1 Tax=Desulfofundulus thermocisternus TaxID=42471 RepID=UPI0019F3399A|nr:hypothetical protein [Desulfofundulus thermocisternus]MBE3585354.1 hypothetical protein [Thermoanaerobacter sp.]MCS5695088.1 hypothetical protein [Desulfofundulus thermocisternus]